METLVPSAPPGLQPALSSLPSSLCPVTCHFLETSFKLQFLLIRGTDSLLQPQPQLTTGPASAPGFYLHTSPPTSLRPGHSALLQPEGPSSHRPGTDRPNTQIRDSSCHQKAQAPGRDVHQEALQSGVRAAPGDYLHPPAHSGIVSVSFSLFSLCLSLSLSLPLPSSLLSSLYTHTHCLSSNCGNLEEITLLNSQTAPASGNSKLGRGRGRAGGRALAIPHPFCVSSVHTQSRPCPAPTLCPEASASPPLLSSPLNPRGKLLGDKEGWEGPVP